MLEIAPSYFDHLANTHNKAVALAKIFGFYTSKYSSRDQAEQADNPVKIHDLQTSTKKHMDLMVMENLFYKQSISQTYDLKGIGASALSEAMFALTGRRTQSPESYGGWIYSIRQRVD
jgi:1-phosphatidylinositol-3-phosphate 5-kinase